jgi:hypothetical protein
MTTFEMSVEEKTIFQWLESNSSMFLYPEDKILCVILLKNTIKLDERVKLYGLDLDNKYEIRPKAIFIVEDLVKKKEVGILEISKTAIGVKDIGVINVYAKMIDPKYAILLCSNSLSKELTYLITNPRIEPTLLNYGDRKIKLLNYK